jgi:hypothetical protein
MSTSVVFEGSWLVVGPENCLHCIVNDGYERLMSSRLWIELSNSLTLSAF